MTQLIVNGQTRSFSFPVQSTANSQGVQSSGYPAMTVAQLLEQMGLQGKRIAVERNGEIVPRSTFDQPLLVEGDRVEIVVAVGGG
jgi:sulfur carrier protein